MQTTQDKNAVNESSAAFFNLINHPLKFKFFLLQKLPAAYFSGLKLIAANEKECSVSVPFKWFTQNPFRSTYFACLSMAAEMTTGALAMAHIYKRKPSVSMLIIGMESKYYKKAVGNTIFTCNDGELIKDVINESVIANESKELKTYSVGKNESGEIVAEFWFTWSFKVKSRA